MRVLSVQVGKARNVAHGGRETRSAIFKNPALGRVTTDGDRLEGDRQADLRHHGGPFQAVYAYPSEHYAFWERTLDRKLGYGAFGENLTTEGLFEKEICSGDTFRIGTALLMATAPRIPCYKLGIRHERPEIVQEFLEAECPGIYFRIVEQGELGAGDKILAVDAPRPGITMVELMRLYVNRSADRSLLQRACALESIKDSWRSRFQQILD